MKNFLFNKLFLSSTVFLSGFLFTASAVVANPSQTTKTSTKYRCINHDGYPKTIAYTSRGAVELIVWKNQYFSASGYTPERRCREVTSRFQHHSDAKNLRYISTGILNRYKIICVSDQSGNCKRNGLLITLQHNHNSEAVMRALFNISARRSGGGINLSASKETIDLDKFLAASPVITNLTDNSDEGFRSRETMSPNLAFPSENETTPQNGNPSDNNKPVINNPWENW